MSGILCRRGENISGHGADDVQIETTGEALATLNLAIEAATIGIWKTNVQTGELFWSQTSRRMLGVDPNKPLTFQDLWDRIHPLDLTRVRALMEEALGPQSSGEWNAEYRICRPDGETRFLHANGRTLFHEDNGIRHATYRIVTAVDRTEQRQAQAALLEAGQLAAIGRLAAAVSHEINNPLEAAVNLLYLLRFEIPGRTGREYLGQAESELARVSQIATNTLRLYKGQQATVPFELKNLTQSVLQLFQERMAMRGIDLDYRLEDGIFIPSSEGEIQQVLVNLVGNAIDAMPTGGRLQVRCRAFRSRIGHREPGVGICIADTGTGMSRETLQRVFEPFFTTKGDAGTGIGLWLSSEILHKHGFKLSVKSKLGRGTVMSMYLPDKVALSG